MKEKRPEKESLGWIILLVAAVVVGAVSAARSQEECVLRVNPNGGSWMGSSHAASFEMRRGGTMNVPTPEREHYEFAGWTLEQPEKQKKSIHSPEGRAEKQTDGNALPAIAFAEESQLTMEGEDVVLTAQWTPEVCSVVCVDMWEEEELGRSESTADYGTRIRGADWGDDTTASAYYDGYTYIGCTTRICTEERNEVHRMFAAVVEEPPADSSLTEPEGEKNSVLSGLIQKVIDKEENNTTEPESAE